MTTSDGEKEKHKYKLRFIPEAWNEWQSLDGSVKANLKNQLKTSLAFMRVWRFA